jgi:hypothetical protein
LLNQNVKAKYCVIIRRKKRGEGEKGRGEGEKEGEKEMGERERGSTAYQGIRSSNFGRCMLAIQFSVNVK